MSHSPTFPVRIASAVGAVCAAAFVSACSAPGAATPAQRLAERLRNTTWQGAPANLALLGTIDYRPGRDGERVEFRGDSTVVFSRAGATVEAVYAVADSSHLRVRPVGSAAGQLVLVNLTNGDTIRLLPNPFPAVRAASTLFPDRRSPFGAARPAATAYGEWLRADGKDGR